MLEQMMMAIAARAVFDTGGHLLVPAGTRTAAMLAGGQPFESTTTTEKTITADRIIAIQPCGCGSVAVIFTDEAVPSMAIKVHLHETTPIHGIVNELVDDAAPGVEIVMVDLSGPVLPPNGLVM